ncbi:hypothetical protein ACVWWO_005208 [Bradyrhizobium sp. F1.13.1]
MILDTRAKALALDEHKDPLGFVSLDGALANCGNDHWRSLTA